MQRWIRRSLCIALAAAALVSAGWAPSLQPTSAHAAIDLVGDPAPGIIETPAEQALLDLLNADRAQNGLPPLDFDPDTLSIARRRASTQLQLPNLSHYDDTGQLAFVRFLTDAELQYQLAGENLARAEGANDPTIAQRIEQALMGSPNHRHNILERNFTLVAIGAATDSLDRIAFAEIFREQ
jgi:uncharacterized protein YkwD